MHVFLASNRSGDKTGKRRSFAEEIQFIKRINGCHFKIKMGFVERMQVEGSFYVNRHLEKLMFDELRHHVSAAGVGGFLPGSNCLQIVCAIPRTKSRIPTAAMKQIANVAALPGIVGVRILCRFMLERLILRCISGCCTGIYTVCFLHTVIDRPPRCSFRLWIRDRQCCSM